MILKPEWCTDAVYTVLDNKQVINNQGYFTRDDLRQIWKDKKYSSMRGELLELMKKFQLCYEIPNSKDTFIAPQLLSYNQPEYDWNQSNNLILRYAYPDFMPKGILSRFIVLMHQYIDQQKYVWQTGVILNKDNTKAEVIEHYGKREIRIRIAGSYKRELLNNVTYELDRIHYSYNRLNYRKLIPCNCHQCKNSQSPYFYPFDSLRTFIAHKQYNIQCQNSYEMVNVLSLIDDLVDLQPLISQDKQDINKSFHFEGDIQKLVHQLLEQDDILGDIMTSDRKIEVSGATVNVSGAVAFSLDDISGKVANTINQLPSFEDEPDKKELKKLLSQLQSAAIEEDLDEEEKEETLEQIQAIAEALQNSQDTVMKKTAKKAMKMLRGYSGPLPPDTSFVNICKQLPALIAKIF